MSELVGWEVTTWGTISDLRYGKALRDYRGAGGDVPVFGTNGPVGLTDSPQCSGPGVIIGRKGAYRGVHYSELPFWVIDTAFYLAPKSRIDMRWAYYSLQLADINGLDSGSAIPSTTRESFGAIAVLVPPLPEQQAIAEVLGALDDKIAANTALAERAESLASLTYDAAVTAWPRVPMNTMLEPILGGTPPRARNDYWSDGDQLWISARDITSAPNRVVLDTAEKITLHAVSDTKAKALPTGSVILTARGTVGEVGRLARPASFNQSCYGFRPDSLPPGLLYFSILRATQRAKAVAHGSVFDTITKATFGHLDMAWDESRAALAEEAIAPILDVVSATASENRTLAATRDALLPQLMSGKLRVRDAEEMIAQAGV